VVATASQLRDRALFYRQLATTLDAGMTPIEAVAILSRDRSGSGRRAREVSEMLRDPDIDLAQALAAGETDPHLGPARAALLRTGWESGRFTQTLATLGRESEERLRALRRLRAALMRPALLAVLTPLILAVPSLFTGGMAAYLRACVPPLLIIAAIAAAGVWLAGKIPGIGRTVPVLGPLARERAWGRASLVLHHFFNAGLSPAEALRQAASAAGPGPERPALAAAAGRVERGESLTTALPGGADPPMLVRLLQTGEVSGTLAEMAARAHQYHEEEALRRMRNAARITVGVAVAVVMAWAAWRIVSGFLTYLGPDRLAL
jgi:type II secretory pathway component PulF